MTARCGNESPIETCVRPSIIFRRNLLLPLGLVLLVALALARLPWLEADPGNEGFWCCSVFTGDEGDYTSGGRIAYLTGRFLDHELADPHTFSLSSGMYFLSYLGYRLLGLSYGAARIPTMLVAILGWMSAYWLTSRRTSPFVAFWIVLIISCNPISLTYERIASTDIVVGGAIVLSYALATHRRLALACLGGVPLALALAVKLTALGFFPLLLLALVLHRKQWPRRLAGFATVFAVTALILFTMRQRCISIAALPLNGVTPPPMPMTVAPSLLDYSPMDMLTALSVFPRWPVSCQMGIFVILLFVLPAWYLMTRLYHGKSLFTQAGGLCLGVLAYASLLATHAWNPLRYALPLFFLSPILLQDAKLSSLRIARLPGRLAMLALGTLLCMLALYWFPASTNATDLNAVHYSEFLLPARHAWAYSGVRMAAGFCIMGILLHQLIPPGRAGPVRRLALVVGGSALATWIFFSNFTISIEEYAGPEQMQSILRGNSFVRNQTLLQLAALAFGLLVFASRSRSRSARWYLGWIGLAAACVVFNTHWSLAYKSLLQRHYDTRNVAAQLATHLPANAIVLGDRASTLLRNTRLRLGLCSVRCGPTELISIMERIVTSHPDTPVYWLVDSDYSPQWMSYEGQGKDRLEVQTVEAINLPSSYHPNLIPVQVFRLSLVKPQSPPTTPPKPGHSRTGPKKVPK